jgi:hypothetical protein
MRFATSDQRKRVSMGEKKSKMASLGSLQSKPSKISRRFTNFQNQLYPNSFSFQKRTFKGDERRQKKTRDAKSQKQGGTVVYATSTCGADGSCRSWQKILYLSQNFAFSKLPAVMGHGSLLWLHNLLPSVSQDYCCRSIPV